METDGSRRTDRSAIPNLTRGAGRSLRSGRSGLSFDSRFTDVTYGSHGTLNSRLSRSTHGTLRTWRPVISSFTLGADRSDVSTASG